MVKKYDIIIYGASGCTGKYVVLNLHSHIKNKGINVSWAIAGRNKQKLIKTLELCEQRTGDDFKYLDIIVANISDKKSLISMTEQANIIINCCGPFKLYAEYIIEACINTYTHYVDVSIEHENMEELQYKYHEIAKEKNIYIVSSCAFDCAVMDLGTVYLQNKFQGVINSIETYLEVDIVKTQNSDSNMTSASWETLITSFSSPARNQQFVYKPLPILEPKLKSYCFFHRHENKWFMHFNNLNKPVLERSQRYFYEHDGRRPIQIENYFRLTNMCLLIKIMFAALIFMVLTKFSYGRRLLRKIQAKGETSEQWNEKPNEYLSFIMTFVGKGWCNDKNNGIPNKTMITRISATDDSFLFGITAKICLLSALTILEEQQQMPDTGGVYTPSTAFHKTKLLEKMHHVLKYEVIYTEQ